MKFLVIPVETLKTFDKDWEHRRKSNDGTQAIIHKEIYDKYFPEEEEASDPKPALKAKTLKASPRTLKAAAAPVSSPDVEQSHDRVYPYPLVTGEELNEMDEFKSTEEVI